ncbi:MAG: hypothetical protein JNL70_16125 [Saprospiraceae bacterium]|nr:hypothetical protein [Saprospiraceae bacterium]
MKLLLTHSKTIEDVQQAFSDSYPHLKIEFFTRPHDMNASSWSKHMITDRTQTLEKIGMLKEGVLTLTDDTVTGEFEQLLSVRYGLFIQVFRKSMGSWLESTRTDSWTLGEQERKGMSSATTVVEMVYDERTNDDAVR